MDYSFCLPRIKMRYTGRWQTKTPSWRRYTWVHCMHCNSKPILNVIGLQSLLNGRLDVGSAPITKHTPNYS